MVSNIARLTNIALRCATLGARFLFIFFLAKYLDPASMGYYGLFTATVGYALYFVGLDFYAYASREVIKTPPHQRGQLLKGQAALSGLLYLLLLPVVAGFLLKAGWPGHLAWWFVPILMLEHFNQEVSRLLVALSEQLASSMILFVRQGSWALAIIALMTSAPSTRRLDFVMALWLTAGLAAASAGVWKIKQLKTKGWHLPVDWVWVWKGAKVSLAFLVATLALRGVQTFDRYWLETLGGIEIVGCYVLLLGVASTLITFLDAAVFAFAYPELIRLSHDEKHLKAHRQVIRLLAHTIIFCAAFGVVSWLVLPSFLAWIGNKLYQQSVSMYLWLLSAMVLNAISMVPHYALYARGKDKHLIYSHITAFIAFGIVTWLFGQAYVTLAVPIGLNAAFATLLIWKSVAYLRLIHHDQCTGVKPLLAPTV